MLDLNKPVQTRDGRKVRIFVTDANFHQPVIGEVEGERFIRSWSLDGHWLHRIDNECDLVNVPEKPRWFVHRGGFADGTLYLRVEGKDAFAVLVDREVPCVSPFDFASWTSSHCEITEADANALLAEARKPKVKTWTWEGDEPIVFVPAGEWGDAITPSCVYESRSGGIMVCGGIVFHDQNRRPLRRVEAVEAKQ